MKPPFEKIALPTVKNVIAIASGKGGVGKSTVAANLAVTLANLGYDVGLVDADIYGPSVPVLFGLSSKPDVFTNSEDKAFFIPHEKFGIKLMSVGFFYDPKQALLWRAPIASKAVINLFEVAHWESLDFLLIDMPPGTGDIHLSISQQIPLTGAIVVTTPHQLAYEDARKALDLYQNKQLHAPILGVVENMAWFSPEEHPDEKYYIFGKGAGDVLAKEANTELLAQVPIFQNQTRFENQGLLFSDEPDPRLQATYNEMAKNLLKKVK